MCWLDGSAVIYRSSNDQHLFLLVISRELQLLLRIKTTPSVSLSSVCACGLSRKASSHWAPDVTRFCCYFHSRDTILTWMNY